MTQDLIYIFITFGKQSKQSHLPNLNSSQSPNHILAKSSDIYMHKAEGLPTSSLSNQFLVNNVSRSAATPLGFTRSNFLPKPYSFASNTGNLFLNWIMVSFIISVSSECHF